jgi:hypothetical protein
MMILKNKPLIFSIVVFITSIVLWMMPSDMDKSSSTEAIESDPIIKHLVRELGIQDSTIINQQEVWVRYPFWRLVFNAYPHRVLLANRLICYAYEVELKNYDIKKMKKRLELRRERQKYEFENDVKNMPEKIAENTYFSYDKKKYEFYNKVPLKDNQLDVGAANKYINLCASENDLAKKAKNKKILGDYDFFEHDGDGNYVHRAYPIVLKDDAETTTLMIVVFAGVGWWYDHDEGGR